MFRIGLLIAALVTIVDQLSKFWLVAALRDLGQALEIAPFFNLVMVWNSGISFGLLPSSGVARWLLVAVSLAITVALLIWLKKAERMLLALAIGALIGGAVGNIIDRVYYGAVADFFDIHLFGYHWPAFNIADSAITIGVVLILYDGFFARAGKSKDGEAEEGEEGGQA